MALTGQVTFPDITSGVVHRLAGGRKQNMSKTAKPASDLSDADLKTLIQNHERAGQTQVARYRDLVEEHARRFGHGLRVDVSLACLVEAARAGRFTTYGDLAEANNVPWSQARRRMSGAHGHLDNLLSVCHARKLPLLTALCVNKEATSDGEMVDEALHGFVKGAQRLGYKVTDERAFLRECQRLCFAWGERASSEVG